MFGLDKALRLPGDLAKELTKTAAQLPSVPLDVAQKSVKGMEEGIDKLTKGDK